MPKYLLICYRNKFSTPKHAKCHFWYIGWFKVEGVIFPLSGSHFYLKLLGWIQYQTKNLVSAIKIYVTPNYKEKVSSILVEGV